MYIYIYLLFAIAYVLHNIDTNQGTTHQTLYDKLIIRKLSLTVKYVNDSMTRMFDHDQRYSAKLVVIQLQTHI